MGKKTQEVREAKAVVVEAWAPNQEPHMKMVAEVAPVVVLVEEEEVLVADYQASTARKMMMMTTIQTKEAHSATGY